MLRDDITPTTAPSTLEGRQTQETNPGRWTWNPPKVELVLSRPAYRVGGTVVGTVRLISPTFTLKGSSSADETGIEGVEGEKKAQSQQGASSRGGGGGSETPQDSDGERQLSRNDDGTEPLGTDAAQTIDAVVENQTASPSTPHPRSVFTSAQLYLAGRCRIDPRWHNSQSLAQLYGTHPHLSSLNPDVEGTAVDAYFGERNDGVHVEGGSTVCFWATNVVNLLELDERSEGGSWENLRPKPLRLGGDKWMKAHVAGRERAVETADDGLGEGGREKKRRDEARDGTSFEAVRGSSEPANVQKSPMKLDENHIALSFRADLPGDVPPSAKAACARYFYSAVVCAKTESGETMIVQAPFAVVSSRSSSSIHAPQPEVIQSSGRVKIGTCAAVAHSNGLPCYISATSMIRPSKISVNRNVGLCSQACASDVRSLRVTDQVGLPCCVLTLVGTSVMYPGGRAMIHFDFNEDLLLASGRSGDSCDVDGGESAEAPSTRLLSCHQVSATLQGEEVACYDDGSRRKTRTYMFDSSHSAVEMGYTESVSLSLVLPLDCPCSLRTDLVEIKIVCKVEITVDQQGGEGYDVLRLELPCEVVQDAAEDNGDGHDEEEDMPFAAVGIMPWEQARGRDETSGGFHASDIMHDLRMLSLHMLDAIS